MSFFSNLFGHPGSAFSSIDIVSQCLVDTVRTGALEQAIRETIRPEHTVLDVGTGSGILSLFAARAGAKKVISLEFDPFIADMAREVIKANGYENVIEIRIANGKNYTFELGLKFDVVIMEMLTTGMIDEHQVPAINNIHRQKAVHKDTVFLPYAQDTFITLGDFNFNCYGFSVPFIRHLWKFHKPELKEFKPMAEKTLLNSIQFMAENPSSFSATLTLTAAADGVINSVLLESVTHLAKEMVLPDTDALNGPVAIPLPPTQVKAGQQLRFSIDYIFGGGYENVKTSLNTI